MLAKKSASSGASTGMCNCSHRRTKITLPSSAKAAFDRKASASGISTGMNAMMAAMAKRLRRMMMVTACAALPVTALK